MGTLDHQIKLTTAQVIFLFLASSRQLYLFKQNFYCSSLPWLPQPPLQNKNLKQNKKTLLLLFQRQIVHLSILLKEKESLCLDLILNIGPGGLGYFSWRKCQTSFLCV